MKKILKTSILFGILLIAFTMFSKVEAASASINASKTNATVGEDVTINVSITAATWNLNVSGNGITGEPIVGMDMDAKNVTTTQSFKLNTSTAGTYVITMSGDISDANATSGEYDTINKSVTVNVAAATPSTPTPEQTPSAPVTPTKSSNANLANLGITPNDFSGFTASKTDYYVTVPNEVSSVNVYAKKAEASQTISGTGNKSLEVGTNKCSVTVTAENGTQKTYNIYVTRKVEETETIPNVVEEPEKLLKLATLEVENATLSPDFNPDVYEYEIELTDNTIEKLNILATANIENASIEVTGNENFMEGENTISIVLKSEDGTKAATYTITVTKGTADGEEIVEEINEEESQEPMQEEKKNVFSFLKSGNTGMIVILVIAIIVLLASITTVVVILVKNRKEAKAEMMSFTPNSEYNVFKENSEEKNNKEEIEKDEKPDKEKRKGKHF